jgi:signal recognition particle subunit SRP54
MTLDDFADAVVRMQKSGRMQFDIPGFPSASSGFEWSRHEQEVNSVLGIIRSMTREERHDPESIDDSRRSRIAAGSGQSIEDVKDLVQQFMAMSKMMDMLRYRKSPWW